ncbi:uncharacterized protein LOC143605201 [Bidens hawaiensis]|uniref:uncharacterized protein LOC143605201 n=1 Tax=Bidens hawaiensis TaxID=980011 RepID=UPI00404939BB
MRGEGGSKDIGDDDHAADLDEGDGGSEDECDDDYIVDPENNMIDPEVDMSDYRMNVDSDVEYGFDFGNEQKMDLGKDVIENDKFLSGSESDGNETSSRKHILHEQIEENPNISLKVVQGQFRRKYGVSVHKMKAYRAKMKAKKTVEEDYKEQYSLLREYAAELVDKNLGSTMKIVVEPPTNPESITRQFKRVYVCLVALKYGFKALNMDLHGLDGAFMKGTFPGQMLTTVGLDSNNGIYPVCYAIMESESNYSWTWFLELLSEDLEIGSNSWFTFMSDRQKGLLQAIQTLFPCAEHRYCLRHIHENMKLAGYRGRAVFDVMIKNTCEVYNGKIVEGRDRPIIPALEYDGLLTPRAIELFATIQNQANHYHVQLNGEDLYEVSGKPTDPRVLNLALRTCSCRGWEITGLPCRHDVATLWVIDANGERVGALESWVHPVHTMDRWKLVYSFKINPKNRMSIWTKCEAPTTIVEPKHHTMAGRPKKARKRSAVEKDDLPTAGKLTRKNTLGACSRCGSTSHNVRTCTGPLKKKGKKAA